MNRYRWADGSYSKRQSKQTNQTIVRETSFVQVLELEFNLPVALRCLKAQFAPHPVGHQHRRLYRRLNGNLHRSGAMNAITCLGLLVSLASFTFSLEPPADSVIPQPPRSLRLAHFAILLQIPRDPSPFESLPTEIITHIAEIAQDTHIAEQAKKPREGGTCPCCERETEGRHVGVAGSVVALGGTSRRIRAILVNAGFFRTISRQVIADELFSLSVEATDGFLDNAE
jgi:hypothetical protein